MFKFIHRKLFNNHLKFKWKLMENSICNCCGKEIETLDHMYYNCDIFKNLWEKIKKCIQLNFHNSFY